MSYMEACAFNNIPECGWVVDGVKIHHPDAYSDKECWLSHVRSSIPKIDKAFTGKRFGIRWYLPTIMALNNLVGVCIAETKEITNA